MDIEEVMAHLAPEDKPTKWQKVKPKPKATGAGLGGALALIGVWVAGMFDIEIPADVGVAFGTVFAFVGAWLAKDA